MSPKKKHHQNHQDRATILRRHLADKVPVSDLCNEDCPMKSDRRSGDFWNQEAEALRCDSSLAYTGE